MRFEGLGFRVEELDRKDRVRGDFLDGQPDAVDARLPKRGGGVCSAFVEGV